MPERSLITLLIVSLAASLTSTRADVKLPAIFGDHMVLQQDSKIPVWGSSSPGEHIAAILGSDQQQTVADHDGKWRIDFEPLPTVTEPQTLTIKGNNTLIFTDVLVGDVWFASGQSNMERDLSYSSTAKADTARATDAQIRVFTIPRTNRLEPQSDMQGKWMVCSPLTARAFTAVGYYFARELRPALNRPIGLIASYWGGTPIQSWISLQGFEKPPAFTHQIQEFEHQDEFYKKNINSYPKVLAEYDGAREAWKKAAAQAKASGQALPSAPREPANPYGRPNVPTSLYNGMVAPFIPYGIKGVIWYQGESDAGSIASSRAYARLFPLMITDWRIHWGQGNFPFLFVQLPNFNASAHRSEDGAWAWLRDSQTQTLALPATGMAVTIDIGDPDNIHPHDKLDVGLRLAQVAKALVYDQKVISGGPVYASSQIEGNHIRIAFKNSGTGLKIGAAPWTPSGAPAIPPAVLTSFTIAGADKIFHPAQAKIDGQTIIVSSPEVPSPVAVRYAWADNPAVSLYNQQNFPAAPFRTDDWSP